MTQKRSCIFSVYFLCLTGVLLLSLAGCGGTHLPAREKVVSQSGETLAIVGFKAALDEEDIPKMVRDPISGTVFQAEPIPAHVVREMTRDLFERLKSRGDRHVLPPGQALGAYSTIASGRMELELLPGKMLQEIGKVLGVDYVLAGYVYRWKEREGSDYAAKRTASVAFSLHLLRVTDGRVVWSGKFDKTQRPLSENILDWKTFLGGKGRWMSARKLASLGLEQLIAEMP